VQIAPDHPSPSEDDPLGSREQLLEGAVELDRLLFIDAFLTLQPFDDGIPATAIAWPRRSFHSQADLHTTLFYPCCEIDDLM
jgi:hypothetical protein